MIAWVLRSALFATAISVVCLTGCTKKEEPKPGASSSSCSTCVEANDKGFVPSKITLPKGAPGSKATLTFTRTTDDTCASDIWFPELNVKKPLPLKQPVTVEIPTDTAKTLTFQCGMAMYKSSVVIQ